MSAEHVNAAKLEQIRREIAAPNPLPTPTKYLPGEPGKIVAMAERETNHQQLYHPRDAHWEIRDGQRIAVGPNGRVISKVNVDEAEELAHRRQLKADAAWVKEAELLLKHGSGLGLSKEDKADIADMLRLCEEEES